MRHATIVFVVKNHEFVCLLVDIVIFDGRGVRIKKARYQSPCAWLRGTGSYEPKDEGRK